MKSLEGNLNATDSFNTSNEPNQKYDVNGTKLVNYVCGYHFVQHDNKWSRHVVTPVKWHWSVTQST